MDNKVVYTKKDEYRSYYFLFFLVITLTIISTGLKIRMWATNGVYQTTRDENTVVAFVQKIDDPSTKYTVLATSHGDDIITYFPLYIPWEGQYVGLFRVYAETKSKTWPYTAWVAPKQLVITKVIGKLDYTIDEGDRTDQIGYVRNNSIRRYTVTFDKNIPHYRTLSFGVLPEIGDTIRFWYLEIFFSREKFFNLAILY